MQAPQTKQKLPEADNRFPGSGRRWRRIALVLVVLLLPGLLGAWRIVSGDTIDPRHVQRIKDGTTTKMEILTLFGDPQEINREADGDTYLYKSYKDAPALPYKPETRKIAPQSDQLFLLPDKDHKVKKPPLKTQGKILKSTLLIRFKHGTNTVMSHEFKEF
jgi:outer membrane protein assembly factor BamE (lipoprotein component of BamABCDE complex)